MCFGDEKRELRTCNYRYDKLLTVKNENLERWKDPKTAIRIGKDPQVQIEYFWIVVVYDVSRNRAEIEESILAITENSGSLLLPLETTPIMTTRLTPRVRRALLYLQGFDGKKIAKASSHPTLDCACLDMEDGVGITMKEQAREGIVHALQTVDFGRTERLARINAFDTGDLAMRDLEAVLKSSVLPDGIVIPKVESPEDILTVSERLDALGDRAHDTRIVGMIESARSVLNMSAILAAAPHRFDALIFGADDYASTVGATRTKDGAEVEFARNSVLMQAAAYGVSCIDAVKIDFHDEAQLRKESRLSFELGYVGRQVIHPKQIDPVQEEYSPTSEAIEHAAAVVQANREHQQHGEGAFSYKGIMIDMPTVKQFESLLYRAELMGLYNSSK